MPATDPHQLAARWMRAEADHDSASLDDLLADDFQGVGPFGFVLDRAQWLRRFDDGLRYQRLDLSDVGVREHDRTAVAIGIADQVAEYRGQPNPGRFRVGLVMIRGADETGWVLMGVQFSGPMPAQAGGAPTQDTQRP